MDLECVTVRGEEARETLRLPIGENAVFQVVRLETARECMETFWGCAFEEIGEIGGYTSEGEERTISPEELLAAVERQGIDGFTDGKRVFVWLDAERCPMGRLVNLLAHELAHMEPEECWQTDEQVEDEYRAIAVGNIAQYAYEAALQIYPTQGAAE